MEKEKINFEAIWVEEYIAENRNYLKGLTPDEIIEFYQWKEVNEIDMFKKYMPDSIIDKGKTNHIIFHGGCLRCSSQRIHGINRCKGCMYFPTEGRMWQNPDLFIDGELAPEFKMDEFIKLINEHNKKNEFKKMKWIKLSDRVPVPEIDGEKILVYRTLNECQKDQQISVFNTYLMRHCNPNETWWMCLPEEPIIK